MYAIVENATELRKELNNCGIKSGLWSGFQWTCKKGDFIRTASIGEATYELRIWAEGKGYGWSFKAIGQGRLNQGETR